MRNYKSLLENLKLTEKPVRRYSLSDMISESYKVTFQCEKGTNLYKLAEAHLMDVRNNPTDTDRLSTQLGTIKELLAMKESNSPDFDDSKLIPMKESEKIDGEDLVPEESQDEVEPKEERALDLDESTGEEQVDESTLTEADEPELTDEELEELTKHLETIRKERKAAAAQPKTPVEESTKGMKVHCEKLTSSNSPEDINEERDFEFDQSLWAVVKEDGSYAGVPCLSRDEAVQLCANHEGAHIYKITLDECDKPMQESASYDSLNIKNFSKNSSSKAFYKTFKKMHDKLKEGTALTRQESINLYKAANSAMTHFSVELEHNPDFLSTFNECTSLLARDVDSVLGSLKEGKAPSKKTMKSLAKFYEALILEDEEEELPPIEDEENEFISDEEGDIISEEEEDFDQEYADARVELHKELMDEHGDTEDPAVQEKLNQDAEEVLNLPGITEEQASEITGEEPEAETEETPEDDVDEGIFGGNEKKEALYRNAVKEVYKADMGEVVRKMSTLATTMLHSALDSHDSAGKNAIVSLSNATAATRKNPEAAIYAIMNLVRKYCFDDPEFDEFSTMVQNIGKLKNVPKVGMKAAEYMLGKLNPTLVRTINQLNTYMKQNSSVDPAEDDDDITDDELAELKRHLTEMRKAKKMKEGLSPSWERIIANLKKDGYEITGIDNKNNKIKLYKDGKNYTCDFREVEKERYISGDPEIVK